MKRTVWNKLKSWQTRAKRKPLILKGARQVGKTYILKEFGRKCFPRALISLKYFQEELPEQALCAAGSLLGIHLTDESFPVGKVEYCRMFPMSFDEFLNGVKDYKSYKYLTNLKPSDSIPKVVHTHLWNQLKIYFVVGGLPKIVQTYTDNKDDLYVALKLVRKKQDDLISTYLADMAKHSGKLNSMQIEKLWRNIPAQLAREQDGSAPRFKFKGVIPGIKGFSRLSGVIDWLKTAESIAILYIWPPVFH